MRRALDGPALQEALVTPRGSWRSVDVYASLDSTNLEALRRPDPWRVVVADHQSAGRGRLTRRWEAPARASVAVSCVVPVPVDRPEDWGWLPLITGMAVRTALEQVAGVEGRLKWPNDLLLQEAVGEDWGGSLVAAPSPDLPDRPWRKVCGVLAEVVPADGLVVAGTGVNVDQSRAELPVDTATSLSLCGATVVRREELVIAYLRAFVPLHASWMEGGAGLEALRSAYRTACLTIGQDVAVRRPDGQRMTGRAIAVDDCGRLLVDSGRGGVAHAAGDVEHVRPAGRGAADTA